MNKVRRKTLIVSFRINGKVFYMQMVQCWKEEWETPCRVYEIYSTLWEIDPNLKISRENSSKSVRNLVTYRFVDFT